MSTTAAKLKNYTAQRHTEVIKLIELKKVADKALLDNTYHDNFKCRYKNMDNIYTSFENLHTSIINIVSVQENADLDVQNEIVAAFENDFYHIQAIYTKLFENDVANKMTINSNQSESHSNVKLPKIEIPRFGGDVKGWQTFIDMFNSIVHNNSTLSNIEKFNYLINSLTGAPLALVKCTPLTGNNYMIAYNALLERYQNTRLIATSHWQAIMNAKRVNDSENPHALRQLIDIFNENISVLQNMGFPTKQWDFILFNLLLDRLDSTMATRFELGNESLADGKYYDTLVKYLNNICAALDNVKFAQSAITPSHSNKNTNKVNNDKTQFSKSKYTSSFVVNSNVSFNCQLCSKDHLIYNCPNFLSKTPEERFNLAKKYKWCINCLGSRHSTNNCSSKGSCRLCLSPRRHHTLLHFSNKPTTTTNGEAASQQNLSRLQPNYDDSSQNPTALNSNAQYSNAHNSNTQSFLAQNVGYSSAVMNSVNDTSSTILLATALVDVLDSRGWPQPVRVLLDSASQSHFMSSKCCTRLGLSRKKLSVNIHGVGQSSAHASEGVSCSFKPRNQPHPLFSIDALILPQICTNLPSVTISDKKNSGFSELKLADPNFHVSQPIDMLLGADIFAHILKGTAPIHEFNNPVALDTIFGWIIMGKFESSPKVCALVASIDTPLSSLDTLVRRFWDLEEVPESPRLSPDDVRAETLYQASLTRNEMGRFIVSLPFKDELPVFPDSRDIAIKRFLCLERKLLKDSELYRQYCDFMRDYLEVQHMELIPDLNITPHSYYIPHHCVIKADSSTTKLRVVFDASSRCNNNLSLNDTLLVGPKLQPDICSLLLRFRIHPICFTADIKQMYRQILISNNHQDFQRILWRFSRNDPIQDYRLKTVSFGISSSPFLALRTIQELANLYEDQYPRVCHVLKNDTFVDDIVTGCSTLAEALQLQNDLIGVLNKGCFELRKWASNHPQIVSHLSPDLLKFSDFSLDLENSSLKILGLQWNTARDFFSYQVKPVENPCSKRNILAELARIYDPLGFLTPSILYVKVLLQQLWASGIDWDSLPPNKVIDKWNLFKNELSVFSKIQIPRHVYPQGSECKEIIGFSDASEVGYAAVVYLRTHKNGEIMTHLLCAKSRVAPLKKISIPRLELCAALLLANLLHFIVNNYNKVLVYSRILAFTDSAVVLAWLQGSPHQWTTFVANRVTQIQNRFSPSIWYHVSSQDNPADPGSRGLLPSELIANSLWWAGPPWLRSEREHWPYNSIHRSHIADTSEEQRKIVLTSMIKENPIIFLLSRYSSLTKIQRIVCYILRYVRIHTIKSTFIDPIFSTDAMPISMFELEGALTLLIKLVQQEVFQQELSLLKKKCLLPKPFRKLTPFMDEVGVLRVGGRLVNAGISFQQKHPALLPSNHKLTTLIIEYTHSKYLHPGTQTLLYLLSQRYWILSPRRTIRKVISNCLKCFRTHPKSPQPPMGDLPQARISQVKPFSKVGMDFCGPFKTTASRIRGAKTLKSYICVFCCMATKAIHLELTSDLSTNSFLASLRRFVARRGRCTDLYSDCGSNFVGASRELHNMMQNVAEPEGIRFHFNPPSSPNFGGLWEAGVKSVKTHLFRVIGEQVLTFEEFYTVLVQIEAILNSRPLCAISSDPNDDSVLTPGHFLTLEPLTSVPDPDLGDIKLGRLGRFELIQRIQQEYWRRWHSEYLHTLMQRSKWTDPATPINIGTVVLLKDDLAPPLKWPRGRVTQLHTGADGVTRVVTVQTTQGSYKRPVSKICPLPNC